MKKYQSLYVFKQIKKKKICKKKIHMEFPDHVTAQLNYVFGFAYAKSRFSHNEAQTYVTESNENIGIFTSA